MAFYDYILLDGYKYKTMAKQWKPATIRPASPRMTLLGNMEGTFGSGGFHRWEGLIIAPHGDDIPTQESYGNILTLRVSLGKRQLLDYTDHYGDAYSVIAVGPFDESCLVNVWNSSANKYYVRVQLTAKL